MNTKNEFQFYFLSVLARFLPLACEYARKNGILLTMGCGRCREVGHHRPQSLHYLGMAQDINVIKDGVLVGDGRYHGDLHDIWDSLGGGRRIPGDLNHYSIEYSGRR